VGEIVNNFIKMNRILITLGNQKMGCICCKEEPILHIALKFPNGIQGVMYQPQVGFMECDINQWLQALYKNGEWNQWIAYNDDTSLLGDNHHKKGHCKGLIAWNDTSISWLIHSVPNYPRLFCGNAISPIEPNELVYAQSFVYVTLPYTEIALHSIFHQVYTMEAHIYMEKGSFAKKAKHGKDFTRLQVTPDIVHLAKPPQIHMDFFQHLLVEYPGKWKVQTWKRGHPLEKDGIEDIQHIKYKTKEWKTSQDHSKWGVNDQGIVWIGDLNRMSSQESRGGGGLIIYHEEISQLFQQLIQ
jgi:hypothetical protein